MSKTNITVERVNEVKPHPNADRLEIIQVLGYQVVCGRGQFKIGDEVCLRGLLRSEGSPGH